MERCCAIMDPVHTGHDNPFHPECAARLLRAASGIPGGIPRILSEPASPEQVHRIHDPGYTAWLRERCAAADPLGYIDSDTYLTPYSFDAALHAAGAAITAVARSFSGEHSFALVRPPGHHAERDRAMGFCLLNNVAIGAATALENVDRVAIIDWDVHHGNGTQHSFYRTDRVLYCSVHQEHIFPYSGRIEETGAGNGIGYTINAPLPAGSGTADYTEIFSEVFVPALTRFMPDALMVSAGQDILFDDPLGGMDILPQDLGIFVRLLKYAVDCPLALVLEGGYSNSHGTAISSIFSALRSDGGMISSGEASERTRDTISLLKKIHRLGDE
jgi:acetoin utilization deacetylase AcuC-like enzyme